jgi:predicted DNA-binding transcriptional regulator AlpA
MNTSRKRRDLQSLEDVRLLNEDDVLQLLPISISTLRRMVKGNKFPAPGYLTSRVKVWPAKVIRQWIQDELPTLGGRKDGTSRRAVASPCEPSSERDPTQIQLP